MFNTELGKCWYTVMRFGTVVASNVFQHELDECFGKLKQVIIIADDIMIVGYKPDKLQYKQDEVEFFFEIYTRSSHNPAKCKVSAIVRAC